MTIDRLRSPFNSTLVISEQLQSSAFSSVQTGGVTPYTFTGDGSAETIAGITYKVHRFDYSATAQNITFSRAGNVDILVAAGGGAGGGMYLSTSYAAGGGGAGGLILMYSYGVTASVYTVTPGKGGYDTDGLGGRYYLDANVYAQNSVFGALTAIRGGHGSSAQDVYPAQTGGSGGGGSSGTGYAIPSAGAAGTAGQGNQGGQTASNNRTDQPYCGGGGGSYLQPGGVPRYTLGNTTHKGGDGILLKFDGVSRGYCAGGGGGTYSSYPAGPAGANGGGAGGAGAGSPGVPATGYGCGGGGAGGPNATVRGGAGFNGVVIIRYSI